MFLYIVHHGEAVGPDVDPQRPLSAIGSEGAERLARRAAERGVRPEAIWHSGKLRARQTAEPFWRLCNPLAEFLAVRGLQPNDPPAWICDRLSAEKRDVMLVGHLPNVARVRSLLLNAPEPEFPEHGLVALEFVDEIWREIWRIRSG